MGNIEEKETFEMLRDALFDFLTMNGKQGSLQKDSINPQTDLIEDLGVDSLELMDLMAVVDRKFTIKVEIQEVVSKTKLIDIVGLIQKK